MLQIFTYNVLQCNSFIYTKCTVSLLYQRFPPCLIFHLTSSSSTFTEKNREKINFRMNITVEPLMMYSYIEILICHIF